jgi:hypothetical protein
MESPAGVSAEDMSARQRTLLTNLIELYTDNLTPALAEAHWAKIRDRGFDRLHFAWAGSEERRRGHYYRIHGPSLLIEFDNTQNDANHIHTVIRDLENDFGEDLLRKHYESGHQH